MGKVVHLLSIFHGRADSRGKTASRLPNNTRRKTDRQRRSARRKADCSDDGIYMDVGGRRFTLCHWSNGIRSRSLLSDGQTLSFLQKSQSPTKLTYDLSSFINSRYFYSASSCPLLLRGAPNYSIDSVEANTLHATASEERGGQNGIQTCDLSEARHQTYH